MRQINYGKNSNFSLLKTVTMEEVVPTFMARIGKRGRSVNRVHNDQKQWLAKAILAICVLAMAWPMWVANAEGEEASIDLQANVAYQGSFKDGRWYPARLQLTNESDKALKGELVLSYLNGENGTTDAIVPLELPPGSPVQVTVGVPGVVLNKDTNRIAFYEGGYQNGKEVELEGKGYLDSRNTMSYMIGVVSRDPDTFNFMPQLNQRGYDIIVHPLQPDDLPEESQLLDSFDTLVINDTATGDWSETRVSAIKDWVTRGGTLVLAGGAGYEQTAEAFADIAPIDAAGTQQLSGAPALAAAGGEELALPGGLAISTGEAKRGSPVIVEGGVPLAITAEQGFGDVVYAAFDPSLEPLASWSGSAMLWAKLLSTSLAPLSQINLGSGYGGGYMNGYWQLNNILDLFPSIKQPAFMLLIGMLAIYILVIAPILYILLSKADRREWAWWLIPVLSIVMGVTVFMIGSEDKRNVLAHTVELVELSGDGHAVLSGGTAIFTPTGGTLTSVLDEAVPIRMLGANGMNNGLNGKGQYQLWSGMNETKTVWKSVPYWSTRKLWMDRRVASLDETGTLKVDLKEDNGNVRMTVTNDTPVDLTDVHYLNQGLSVKVGDLKSGESGEIVQPSQSQQGGFSYHNYAGSVFPYPSNNAQGDEYRRQRELIEIYFNRYNGSMFPLKPVIIGFSMDHESQYAVNGDRVKSDNLKMWIKELSAVEQSDGRVTVPPHAMTPIVVSNTIQNYSSNGNGSMQVGPGEMELEYMVPNGYGVAFDKLDVGFPLGNGGSNMTWTIWRSDTGEWTELSGDLGKPASYMTEAQSIRLKLVSTADGMIMMPQLSLEGEVLQP
ncbi:MAG: class glutamine amidotransferase-like protein [Paenibacillus sp.]|nr:class glutamine amidotransferase-like protein [Paenibacillus sp.]